jgi:phosphoglycerate transporter family protein
MANVTSSAAMIDQETISKDVAEKYGYWRIRTMYAMMVGYAAFYLVRQNFSMCIPSLQAEFGYTKTDIGLIITIYSIIYGVGKSINGVLSDRMNARYFMTFGLIASAVVNIFMGWAGGLWFIALLWSSNAWFQSMGWPPCARLLTHWYSKRELGTKWGFWNASHQIGGAAIFVLAGFLIEHYGWRSAFVVPGIICVGASVFLFNRLRDTPASVGLPSIEQFVGGADNEGSQDDDLSFRQILFEKVLTNKLVWYVSIANFFLYIVRMGVFNWAPTFLKEAKGSALNLAGWQSAGFEVAGLFGGICAGWLSDRVFKGQRGPVSTIYMVALVLFLIYLWLIPAGSHVANSFALVCVGFFVYGPQVLVGVAAADYASKKAAGAATGMTGTFGYIGGAVSGVGVGYVVDHFGWEAGLLFFVGSAIMGVVFFWLTWHQKPNA